MLYAEIDTERQTRNQRCREMSIYVSILTSLVYEEPSPRSSDPAV
jgi:hypothetical protein